MSGEVSYFSRFFVKFVEIIAAGLASAISAYLLAHFAGLLSSPTPPSHPALTTGQVGPAASGVTAQPTPPVAAATANEHPAPQDAAEPKLAPKASKDAKVLPPRKHPKTDTDVAEKEARSQKSAEALVRAALANVDAKAPADAVIGPGATNTRSAPVDAQPRQANMPLRQADVGPRPVEDKERDATVLARVVALKRMPVNDLKTEWKKLFSTDAPNNSRGFLELRLAHRIQELTYGGVPRYQPSPPTPVIRIDTS
jgi:outer membrane biosynthesis protein TonB